jgi:alpha-mannosidase
LFDEEKRINGPGANDNARRSSNKKPVDISTYFTLKKSMKSLDVKTVINNTCENHRLRVMMPTLLNDAKYSYGESAYDVVQRLIDKEDPNHPYKGDLICTFPFLRYVCVDDKQKGLGFIGTGMHEYEVINQDKILAVTLIRAIEIRLCTTSVWDILPGNLIQVPGESTFVYSIYPYKGMWSGSEVVKEAERINTPLIVCQAGPEKGGTLPKTLSFVQCDTDKLVLSCLKKSDFNKSLILRIFNTTEDVVTSKIKFFKKIKSADFTNMNEQKTKGDKVKFSGNTITLTVPHKKVVTMSIVFEK